MDCKIFLAQTAGKYEGFESIVFVIETGETE